MPRPPRVNVPGQIVHVASRGVAQQAIYRDDIDRERFLSLLSEVVHTTRWRCLTYCLMGNHYHLLLQLREPNLSSGMQYLNGDYGQMFNNRHDRSGHLFQGRFWSKSITRDAHLHALARYIARNPVQAALSRTASEWPWSAHKALLGQEPAGFVDVATMLSYFDHDFQRARLEYATLVMEDAAAEETIRNAPLGEVLSYGDRDEAIAHAYRDLGQGAAEIAAAIGCHPKTVRRRLAAMSLDGAPRDRGV